MKITKTGLVASALIAFFATGAMADHHMAKAIKVMETANGEVLTNAQGMTLYTFDNDVTGKSNCNGGCATNWPPMAATPKSMDEGDFSVISRDDGSPQWAHKGSPLYTWIKDKARGDITGDGVKGVWHLARP